MKKVLAIALLLLVCSACTAQPGGEAGTTRAAVETTSEVMITNAADAAESSTVDERETADAVSTAVSPLSSRESAYVTPALFKILKGSIAQVKFSAEFRKGDSALYASYQKNFLRLLRGEAPLFDGASQQEVYLDEFLRLGGRKIEAMPQISYYFFDMDLAPDAGPELCIVEGGGLSTHIVKYEPVTDHFVLWLDMISDTILGSREVYYYSPNARAVFAYQKLNQSGKAECTVRFYGEGYIEDIYAVALPDYADKSKNTLLSDAMKQQAFYDEAYGDFFRVTEKQWEALRKELYGVEKLAEERIQKVSYTFEELFGDLP